MGLSKLVQLHFVICSPVIDAAHSHSLGLGGGGTPAGRDFDWSIVLIDIATGTRGCPLEMTSHAWRALRMFEV